MDMTGIWTGTALPRTPITGCPRCPQSLGSAQADPHVHKAGDEDFFHFMYPETANFRILSCAILAIAGLFFKKNR